MEGTEVMADTILEDDDVEMMDVSETLVAGADRDDGGPKSQSRRQRRRANRKKWNKNNNMDRGNSDSVPSVADINRFVMDTCRRLRVRKPYLVWNAVGCLGVSAVRELVNEVSAIQSCGGQTTVDGIHVQKHGGILWNILKKREPKAYKEITAKGREFEKQFRRPREQMTKDNKAAISTSGTRGPDSAAGEVSKSSEPMLMTEHKPDLSESDMGSMSVFDRICIQVAYANLFDNEESLHQC